MTIYSYCICEKIDDENGYLESDTINMQDAQYLPSAHGTTEEISEITNAPEGAQIWDTDLKVKKIWSGTEWQTQMVMPNISPIFVGIITATGGSGSTEDYNIPGLLENSPVSVTMRTSPALLPVKIDKVSTSSNTLSVTYSGTPNSNYSLNVIAFPPQA